MLVVTTDHHGDVAVVHAEGEVDLHTAHLLRDALTAVIAAGSDRVIADLTEVSFLDSTGLGVLVGRLRELRIRNGHLRVAANDRILRVIKVTGVDLVLPVHEDVAGALSAFDASPA